MAFTATHDGNGTVTLYGGTATHDGNGVVTLTMDAVVGELGEAIASAQITVYRTAEVEGVWRYYKLQASTLAKPSVPTSNPPTGWTDTEPTYTSGSTNSLYFTDLTVLSDGSWSYSPVSLSSSYEAAKEAYNKAAAAGDAAQSAQDGVNLNKEAIDNTNADFNESMADIRGSMDELGTEVSNQATVIAENTEKIATITNEQGVIQENFQSITTTITDVDGKINAEIQERNSYIRKKDGNILLGDDGKENMQLLLTNKQISFKEQDSTVAWISGKKLYITETEVTQVMRIGNFEFVTHGPNNNLGIRRISS